MAGYLGYVDLNHKPGKSDLICDFYLESPKGVPLKEAAGAVAAESSIGTWTETTTAKPYMRKLGARVFGFRKQGPGAAVRISYPIELFEEGNVPDIMSSIAGNVFGMREVSRLRLANIHFPRELARSFKGPRYGIPGVRKVLGVKKRPLVGTIVKPKLGLNTRDHARVAYNAWMGGCDVVKDDENLSSQSFNRFGARLKETLRMKRLAEKETGEKKVYMINVTAETMEMLKRARMAEEAGNEYAMVDIVTVGWSGLQTLRDAGLGLVLHAHRAGHAAFDRDPRHGIKMSVIARLTRMIGLDQLHVGTVVGKMSEGRQDVLDNIEALKGDFHGIKPVFPVASGGLHPGHIPDVMRIFGNDVVMQFGGGIHGHPKGTWAGARAARQAVEAVIGGFSLKEYSRRHKELGEAVRRWK